MNHSGGQKGFTLIEALVAMAIFLLFAVGIYGGMSLVFKIVYQSRLRILETALLSEELEIVRNLPFDSIGIQNGAPPGLLLHAKTVMRNGKNFTVITTVRNIDDPFDGTIGGNPNDTAPADYKLVELSALCQNCTQQEPVIVSTLVAPKNLEGASDNGALFIEVFDANGLPVSGADVRVVNTATDPDTVIDDATDNDGMLRIVDTPTGTLSYNITVSKGGYSSDYTVASSAENSNPSKPPANVVSQTVTEISFAIDRSASLNLHTMNPSCVAVGGVSLSAHGEKIVGTEPDVYKYDETVLTNGSGDYNFPSLEWDKYYFNIPDASYDIAGSIPMSPVNLTPGLAQELSLVLRAHTANSLLVKVQDAGTGLPLSNASVRLSKAGYDSTLVTDLGYLRQTDWSDGAGQAIFEDEGKYWNDDGGLNVNSPAGTIELRKVGGFYLAGGYLDSSTFDVGAGVTWRNMIWEPLSQPPETGSAPVSFQLATSNSQSPANWDFKGPDGTSDTFYTSTSTLIYSGHNGERYMRYRVYLNTIDTKYTPQLSEVAVTYTNSCSPPGQVFFSGLGSGAYTLEVSRAGYTTNSGPLDVAGTNETVVNLSAE